jgi:dipeptidyl aminopeptidase/acylaminoacyl peptidase
MPLNNKKGFSVLLIIILLGLIAASVFLSQRKLIVESPLSVVSQALNFPTPTPMPFQEMTIPFLRQREYKSSLGELKQLSQKQNYTAYITSFASEGFRVYGYLTRPTGSMPLEGWPAIIFIHGYIPPKEYSTSQDYISYVDYLAKNGFVVFKIDLRGHDNSEGEPGGAYYSEDYVIDTLNAYAALESSGFVNKDSIGLWGHSMAGNVVMRAFAARPDIPAVVIWAGAGYTYSDLQEYRIEDNSYRPPPQESERVRRRQELRNIHGDFNPESEFWKQVAVTNYLKDLKGALEIHHAINDNVVSIDYSRNLMNLLDQTTVPHTLYEYSSGGHNITGASFNQAMQKSVEFFSKYL